MGSPSAAITGKYDGDGMWIPPPCPPESCSSCPVESGPASDIGVPDPAGTSAPPATTGASRPPSPSAYFRCQKSSRVRITGTSSKFQGGGGDVVIHSTVRASHGSDPAGSGLRKLRTTL